MVLLFYVDECLMFITPEDKFDELYASLKAYFKIKYDGYPNNYIEIDLDSRKDVSINIRHNDLTQRILTSGSKCMV